MHDTRLPILALAALALAAGPLAAQDSAAIPPGIYAMAQGPSDATAHPQGDASALTDACRRTPTLVQADGLIRSLTAGSMDSIQSGGPIYERSSAMRCDATGGTGVACAVLQGADDTTAGTVTATFADLGNGQWRIGAAEHDFALFLAPCDMAMYDMALPDGRNVFDELVARDDGGPALARP